MAVLKRLATVLIAGGLSATASAGVSQSAFVPVSSPSDIKALPVLTADKDVGSVITVCMYPGARPEQFRVIGTSCQSDLDRCTAFVALRTAEEVEMLAGGFDLTDPPVEATGPTCDRPRQPTVGGRG